MSSENSVGAKFIIMLLIILIGFPVAFYFAKQKQLNYQVNGTEVTATVINVESLMVGRKYREWVTVTYENQDGDLITAKAINAVNVVVNDTIVGRVVPEKPEEVFVEQTTGVAIVAYVIVGLLYSVALFFLVAVIIGRNTGKKMAKQGKITEALIIRREQLDGSIFVDVEFEDDNGILRYGSCRVPEYIDTTGRTCTIRYLAKAKNKAICEMSM